ncbi:MAG TPA: CHASE2 domain-containing protein, partial [Methylomirabilota bacterium]|nr:CHASE2 domain-containing protein [Methylomirabilota bacterium]
LEWITYDWRVKEAAKYSPAAATNLGFVAITDASVDALLDGSLPYQFGLLWPRQVYGRLVDELSAQGAKAIGFDVLLAELRPDHLPAQLDGETTSSDEFFARALRRSSNVILASEGGLFPPDLFVTNAAAVAHISAHRERDGILRRTHVFLDIRVWHPMIKQAAQNAGWDLENVQKEPDKLIFPRRFDGGTNVMPLNADGKFDAGLLEHAMSEDRTRLLVQRFEFPFQDQRLWQLGIALAARELKLDLNRAVVDLEHGRIVFSNASGDERVIPVDRQGRFYIDWSIGLKDPRLRAGAIDDLLIQYELRRAGRTDEVTNLFQDKLVVVGSTASGNNLSDFGATALEQQTYLVSVHWNVANSLMMNRFIRPIDLRWRLLIIVVLGALAGICTWKLRVLTAVGSVAGIAAAYTALALFLFITARVWLPLVSPVLGSLFVTHVSLITYLVRVERRGRQRTKEVFSRVVSPDIVRELLEVEKLKLGGARRNVTMFFADIRGFTAVTDASQKRAELIVAEQKLTGISATERLDAEAESVLNTVNPYLGLIADTIKKHTGTLDKYIGDCVMAFWGAPVPNPRHAVCCVRAAIDAQRAIFEFNRERLAENERRQEENLRRLSSGENALPMLEILTLGSGINTGMVTVGMVGSEAHLMNYTIFGREVNLASRLEGASGRARILISENTYLEILRDDPELAATCRAQEPLVLKGFSDPIQAHEVPWRPPDVSPVDAGQSRTMVRGRNADDY